jgi:hypothetical protein
MKWMKTININADQIPLVSNYPRFLWSSAVDNTLFRETVYECK